MGELIFVIMIGHFIGDYFFQPRWISLYKKNNNVQGYSVCTFHCLLYTIIVYLCTFLTDYDMTGVVFSMIFMSHFIIDKYGIIEWWLKTTDTRSWDTYIRHLGWKQPMNKFQVVSTSFGAIVYVVADNTAHILLMYIIVKFM